MHVSKIKVTSRQPDCASGGVTHFAAEVVARLVSRDSTTRVVLQERLLTRLQEAALGVGAEGIDGLMPDLRRARVSAVAVADGYIPEVARRLGCGWETDALSFAEVSIGVARLQGLLRDIGAGWIADEGLQRDACKTLLMIVPAGEQHTLGAMVVVGQLRRLGVSVCVRIAPTAADLRALLAERRFDGVLVSVACVERIETCAMLVRSLRDLSHNRLRVAVGGSVLGCVPDLADLTGADIATNDLGAALAALELVSTRLRVLERA